ncbi:MAG TPA: nitronate monooxygenase [Planctomycetaceae bacterium]|jgi:enoyl-[acyl-carrier protein] reductase II|nr:nitronate monooxygenase [Planctomycetaceae bacterium]
MLDTRLTEMLNVRYPIMLAGMAGVSLAEVVAAVSEAGGYGVLGAGNMTPEEITDEIARVRSLTDKPFGVDLLHAINDNPVEEVKRIIDGGATSFAAGLGVPKRVIGMCHEAGLKVITVTATVKHARMAAEAGCDLIVAQGSEAGGHTGSVGAFALLPQAVDAVPIPVVAAGGIFDGRGLVAALAFGCAGVWIGTRFVASKEARAAQVYKNAIVKASESDTVVSRCWTGKTLRALRNATTEDWERHPQDIKPFPHQAEAMAAKGLLGFLFPEMAERDPIHNCFPAGQGCGAIHEVQTCKQIVGEIVAQAETILSQGLVRSTRKA